MTDRPTTKVPMFEADDDPAESCHTCGGEQMVECDGDCPASDDCGCPYADPHMTVCWNCKGSGYDADCFVY